MLAADKLELTSLIKKNATDLKSKELELNKSNFEAVGMQAAVLAGFAVSMIVKLDMPENVSRIMEISYYMFAILNLLANLVCVAYVTAINVMGTGLALRGPDGSMRRSVDGMYDQRRLVFWSFALGLIATCAATIILSWIKMHPLAALSCTLVVVWGTYTGARHICLFKKLFQFGEESSVRLDDVLNSDTVGPESFVRQLGVDSDTLVQLLGNIDPRRRSSRVAEL
eukprot:TRINITY_DN98938_c0_g1_i1.p1 TRINITY_DN98938_c0_g1~~TRINITY_DN98938_c0_g1_i1.p1  ORF type:complete len:234 (-),score=21.15 TRINITY_DN98938_c0_g1_i1:67-744(-)